MMVGLLQELLPMLMEQRVSLLVQVFLYSVVMDSLVLNQLFLNHLLYHSITECMSNSNFGLWTHGRVNQFL